MTDGNEFVNSLSSIACSLNGLMGSYGNDSQLSQVDPLFVNNRWYMLSNLRQVLSQIYVEHGIVQTLVDQPVDDAYRAGFEVKTSELDGDDIEKLLVFAERNQVITAIMQARKWARLYGGGGVLIITDQDPVTPLDINALTPESRLQFRAVDMWELYFSEQNVQNAPTIDGALGSMQGDFYDYYGHRIHKSRVYRVEGKQAPSFIRPRLRGWGMSELERLVRSINQYLKNQNVIYELLDEAKVDVYKMKGFNTALSTSTGSNAVAARIQNANLIKNYNHALTMDVDDDYVQKQVNFTGLAEVLTQIRQGVAADLKMPVTKLFGISAAGFNSGEDDIENYNSMIEGEIRAKDKFIVVDILCVCCQKLFGFIPEDLMISFNPLRILNAKEEEEVKNSQFNRVISAYTSGLTSDIEAKEALNKDSLLPVEIDAKAKALPPLDGSYTVKSDTNVEG